MARWGVNGDTKAANIVYGFGQDNRLQGRQGSCSSTLGTSLRSFAQPTVTTVYGGGERPVKLFRGKMVGPHFRESNL